MPPTLRLALIVDGLRRLGAIAETIEFTFRPRRLRPATPPRRPFDHGRDRWEW